eukprot:scaffold216999_cov30-Tisochrysis_lutea.AAC.1
MRRDVGTKVARRANCRIELAGDLVSLRRIVVLSGGDRRLMLPPRQPAHREIPCYASSSEATSNTERIPPLRTTLSPRSASAPAHGRLGCRRSTRAVGRPRVAALSVGHARIRGDGARELLEELARGLTNPPRRGGLLCAANMLSHAGGPPDGLSGGGERVEARICIFCVAGATRNSTMSDYDYTKHFK